jgi:hypothetical protein
MLLIKTKVKNKQIILDAKKKETSKWVTVKSKSEEGKGRKILLGKGGIIKGGNTPKELQGTKIGSKEMKEKLNKVSEKKSSKEKVVGENKIQKAKENKEKKINKKEKNWWNSKAVSTKEFRKKFIEVEEKRNKEKKLITSKIQDASKQKKAIRKKHPNLSYSEVVKLPEYIEIDKEQNKWSGALLEFSKIDVEEGNTLFSMLEVPESKRGKILITFYGNNSKAEKKFEEHAKKLERILGIGSYQKPNVTFINRIPCEVEYDSYRKRACHTSNGTIKIGVADFGTFVHEFGHHLEHRNLDIKKKCREFREERTKGEKAIRLNKIPGVYLNYSDSEITKKDKFFDPYVGRIYKGGSTEVLSMGLEKILSSRSSALSFAKKDPEYFDLIIDILRGNF